MDQFPYQPYKKDNEHYQHEHAAEPESAKDTNPPLVR